MSDTEKLQEELARMKAERDAWYMMAQGMPEEVVVDFRAVKIARDEAIFQRDVALANVPTVRRNAYRQGLHDARRAVQDSASQDAIDALLDDAP